MVSHQPPDSILQRLTLDCRHCAEEMETFRLRLSWILLSTSNHHHRATHHHPLGRVDSFLDFGERHHLSRIETLFGLFVQFRQRSPGCQSSLSLILLCRADSSLQPLTFISVARSLESVGVSAYLGAAHLLSDPALLTAAGSILTLESRHQSLLNIFNGGSFAGQAFDIALTPQQVLALAGGFLQGCSAADLGLTGVFLCDWFVRCERVLRSSRQQTNRLELSRNDLSLLATLSDLISPSRRPSRSNNLYVRLLYSSCTNSDDLEYRVNSAI